MFPNVQFSHPDFVRVVGRIGIKGVKAVVVGSVDQLKESCLIINRVRRV